MASDPLKPLVERPEILFMNMDQERWSAMSGTDRVDYARCALIEALGAWKSPLSPMLGTRIKTALWLLNDATDGAVHDVGRTLPRRNEIEQARERQAKREMSS